MLIPTNTKLPAFRIPMLKEAIARRLKALAKHRYGQSEESLWLMQEIEHLVELLRFNLTNPEIPATVGT